MDLKDYKKNIKKDDLHFWYKARLIFIEHLLNKYIKKPNNDLKILDIGCGTGTEIKVLQKFGKITALDVNKQALVIAQKTGCEIIYANLEQDKLPSGKFDVVCAFDILEHLEKDVETLQKIYQSLQKNSLLVLTVPAFPFLFGPHDIALSHKRRYSKKELIKKIKDANFEIKTIGYWNSFLFPIEALFRIIKIVLNKTKKQKTNFQTENKTPIKILNLLFFYLLNIDNIFFKKNIKFPFGITLYLVARKK